MTSSCCCNCFSSSKRHQLSLEPEEEPNAFDLTWRNYLLPSSSCCCIPNIFKRKQQPIRLGDDDDMVDDELFISPHQHFDRSIINNNNHNQYHGRAVRGYLDDPRDWEFDSMFAEGEFPAGVVTRNPFGRKNNKKKRKHKKHHPRVIQQQDEEIFSEEIQDAEFLGDDQIAHLAYERSKNMDPYGEEGYIDSTYDRPISQEMQPPSQKEFYAPRTMPSYYFVDQDDENEGYHDDEQQHQCYDNNKQNAVVQEDEYYQQQQLQQEQEQQNEASSSTAPVVTTVAEQAQDLLSERLEDLTDKLIYIRQNMMDLNKKEQEPDNTTLRTLNKNNNNKDNDSVNKGANSDKTASDIDSIASEALNEYERPDEDDEEEHERRRRSAASQYKIPFGGGDTPPFGSDHHPFSYFTEQNNNKHKKHRASSSSISSSTYSRRHSALVDDDNNTPGLTIRGVLDFGKKWFGS